MIANYEMIQSGGRSEEEMSDERAVCCVCDPDGDRCEQRAAFVQYFSNDPYDATEVCLEHRDHFADVKYEHLLQK